MKIQCDVCEKAPATVICCADEAALCAKCDIEVHAANKLASKHQRLLLQNLSNKLPPCDICQEKAAFIFCVEDRALFCRDCDEPIHSAGSLSANHQRFLATGIRVALSSSCSKDTQKSSLEPPNQSEQRPSVKLPSPGFGSSWAVDDFLQFSDFEESTDKKEQLGMGGEFDWLADMGLFGDQLPQEALAAAEVPQLPISPPTNVNSYRATKSGMPHKKPRIEIDDDEFFTVPDLECSLEKPINTNIAKPCEKWELNQTNEDQEIMMPARINASHLCKEYSLHCLHQENSHT
uniref:B box-type domain-containing protein n=1 Tax=Salix viminalis TaxID=40686 RepID=A0A6N2MSL7_SALVM